MTDSTKKINIISYKDLSWLLNCILKNWYFFVIIIPIFTVCGFLYNHKQVIRYKTKIEILLKSNDIYNYQEAMYPI